jgi:hypothetical protein
VLGLVGLVDVQVVGHFDCFRGTSKEKTARKFGVQGANVLARRPSAATTSAPSRSSGSRG